MRMFTYSYFDVFLIYLLAYFFILCGFFIGKLIKMHYLHEFKCKYYLFEPNDIRFTIEEKKQLFRTPIYDFDDAAMRLAIQKKRTLLYLYRDNLSKLPCRKKFTYSQRERANERLKNMIQIKA